MSCSSMEKKAHLATAMPTVKLWELLRLTQMHKWPFCSLLIFWPYGWALVMAAVNMSSPAYLVMKHTMLFVVAATLYHSAFCVWNDICDRDLDGKVERTKDRPLVTGAVSVSEALVTFIILLVLTFVAVAGTNQAAVRWMLASLPINFLYPYMKRWTWWPQFWLGVCGSWGCLVAWASLTEDPFEPLTILPLQVLVAGTVSWIIMLDTMYGAQDRVDDASVGIKSTARLFDSNIWMMTAVFGAGFSALCSIAGVVNGNGLFYLVGAVGGTSLYTLRQLLAWNPDDARSCSLAFVGSHYMGAIFFCGAMLDYLVPGSVLR